MGALRCAFCRKYYEQINIQHRCIECEKQFKNIADAIKKRCGGEIKRLAEK